MDYNLQLPEQLNLSFLLAHVYSSSYISLHFYICLCVFAYFLFVFVYVFRFSAYKIDTLMGGGRPPLIKLSILHEVNLKIYTKTHKNMQIQINICKNVERYIKKYKHLQEENLA